MELWGILTGYESKEGDEKFVKVSEEGGEYEGCVMML